MTAVQPPMPLRVGRRRVLTFIATIILAAGLGLAQPAWSDGIADPCSRLSGPSWLAALTGAQAAKPLSAASPREHLRHAETYLWLGLAERGDRRSFARGLRHLCAAQRGLSQSDAADQSDHSDQANRANADQPQLERRIAALWRNLHQQHHQTTDTLYGLFPLSRLLVPSLFLEWESTATYDLIDHADDVAVRLGTEALAERVLARWMARSQLPVLLHSVPRNPDLENEALYVISRFPKLFPHLESEWLETVGGELPDPLSISQHRALTEAIGHPRPLLLTIHQQDQVDGNYRYLIQGRLLEAAGSDPHDRINAYGLARERHHQLGWVLGLHGLLLLLALLGVMAAEYRRCGHIPPWRELLPLTLGAFLLGRIIPWMVVPGLRALGPAPEALWPVSFWWPLLVGIALFALPVAAYRLLSDYLSTALPVAQRGLRMGGRGGAVGLATTLGVSAYLSVPALLYLRSEALPLVALLAAGGAARGWWLGRILDRGLSLRQLPLALLLLGGLGAAFLSTSLAWLAMASVTLVVAQQAAAWPNRRARKAARQSSVQAQGRPASPIDLEALVTASQSPPFQPTPGFTELLKRLAKLTADQAVMIALSAAGTGGKSAALRALADLNGLDDASRRTELQRLETGPDQVAALGPLLKEALLLPGSCRGGESGLPYGPFLELLPTIMDGTADTLDERGSRGTEGALSASLLGLIPSYLKQFQTLLEPDQARRYDLHLKIEDELRREAKKRPLILSIDDLQWLDPSSAQLLDHLLQAFSNKPAAVALILTADSDAPFAALTSLSSPIIKLGEPDHNTSRPAVLTTFLGLHPAVCQWLAGQGPAKGGDPGPTAGGQANPGSVNSEQGPGQRCGWLFVELELVRELARRQALKQVSGEWCFVREWDRKQCLIPHALVGLYGTRMEALGGRTELLVWAAALGLEFRVGVLAKALGRDLYPLIRELDHISDRQGLIHDCIGRAGVYSFDNPIIWRLLRDREGITDGGPAATDTPERVRAIHAGLARVLEQASEERWNTPQLIARQYYAAGGDAEQLAKAVKWCLRAAYDTIDQFDYDNTDAYAKRAQECAEAAGSFSWMEQALLRLELKSAHRSGTNSRLKESVASGWRYFQRNRDAATLDTLLAIARGCYEIQQPARALELAQEVLDRAKQEKDRYRIAEAHQLIALNLPRGNHYEVGDRLQQALKLCGDDDQARVRQQRGRILDSLGNRLTWHAEVLMKQDPHRANELLDQADGYLRQSLAIKQQPDIDDRSGRARTLGNLGRTAMARRPRELEQARGWFEQDLEQSQANGDRKGQVMMYSQLGEVALEQGHLEQARGHYRDSLSLAQQPANRCFARLGLLRCALAAVEAGEAGETEVTQMAADIEGFLQQEKLSDLGDCAVQLRKLATDDARLKPILDQLCN